MGSGVVKEVAGLYSGLMCSIVERLVMILECWLLGSVECEVLW